VAHHQQAEPADKAEGTQGSIKCSLAVAWRMCDSGCRPHRELQNQGQDDGEDRKALKPKQSPRRVCAHTEAALLLRLLSKATGVNDTQRRF
jgi:hypothetical protein